MSIGYFIVCVNSDLDENGFMELVEEYSKFRVGEIETSNFVTTSCEENRILA